MNDEDKKRNIVLRWRGQGGSAVKHQTPESMKFRKLQRRLGTSRLVTVGTLELLWIACQKNTPQGDIGKFTDEELAIECEWDGDPSLLVDSLVECGWLDRCDTHRLVVHDWPEHCPGWIKRQLARHKKSFVTASSLLTVADDSQEATPNPTQPNPTQPNPTQPNHSLPPDDPVSETENEKTPVGDGPRSKHFASEQFRQVWQAWVGKQERQNFKRMDPLTQEAQLYDLERFDTDQATAIVRFSTGRTNCNNLILDGSHDRQRDGPRRTSGGSSGKKTVSAAEIFGP